MYMLYVIIIYITEVRKTSSSPHFFCPEHLHRYLIEADRSCIFTTSISFFTALDTYSILTNEKYTICTWDMQPLVYIKITVDNISTIYLYLSSNSQTFHLLRFKVSP